jgi:alginate O-acetyltransferase complex protein AlgI
MLFTTAAFVFAYLPLVVIVFFLLGRRFPDLAAAWLFAASVFFYAYWMPEFTVLLLGSILVNFCVGRQICSAPRGEIQSMRRARLWLVTGVVFNLGLLGFFKYVNFFTDSLQAVFGTSWHAARVVLPIGISFFTFTQIAFLADAYQKDVREYKFAHYGVFVTYFPHLIAGPLLHHAQMMPQFAQPEIYRLRLANFAAGFAIFCVGLFKKVVLADGIGPYADAIFNTAAAGQTPTFAEGWLGTLAYTFQLYFDFSGYSDMAIGLSWMLNIQLPFNFDAPYKSRNIIDFWRRWHMTLSAFLRDYLYIPLGGNRCGLARRCANLATTMLLGGLWHGANWTFVFWGGLHGAYLGVNHAFRAVTRPVASRLAASRVFCAASWLLTFIAVMVAWVFFRAPTFVAAARVLRGMFTTPRWPQLPEGSPIFWNAGLSPTVCLVACVAMGCMTLAGPNSNMVGSRVRALCQGNPRTRAAVLGVAATFVVFLVLLNENRSSVSAFIYFNF